MRTGVQRLARRVRRSLTLSREKSIGCTIPSTLSFSSVDYLFRQLASKPRPDAVLLDLRRVTEVTPSGARLLAEGFRKLEGFAVTVVLSGLDCTSSQWASVARAS